MSYADYKQLTWAEIVRRNSIRRRGTVCDVQLLEQPFDSLDWPTRRVLHVLEFREVKTVRDVCLLSEADLLKTKRCGRKTLDVIKAVLAENGLQLFTEYNQMGPDHYWGA